MNNWKKRIFTGLLAAVMTVGLFSGSRPVQAQNDANPKAALERQAWEAARTKEQIQNKLELTGRITGIPAAAKAHYEISREEASYWNGEKWVTDYIITNQFDKNGNNTYHKNLSYYYEWDDEKQKDIRRKSALVDKYSYNNKGLMTKETNYENGKEIWRREMKYDRKGRMSEERTYTNKKLESRYVYKYKSDGRLSSYTKYNSKNKKESVTTYSYNSKKQMTKVVTKNAKGKVVDTTTFKYTYSGKRLTKMIENSSGYTYTVTYYKNGHTKKASYQSKTEDYSYTNTYYENGYMKTEEFKNRDYYSFDKYDKKGNQTYRLEKSSGYQNETTYKNGRPAKQVTTWKNENGTEKNTYTFKYKMESGRVVRQTRYNGKNADYKTEYEYVKIG